MTDEEDITVGRFKEILNITAPISAQQALDIFHYLYTDPRGVSRGGGKSNFDHVADYRYILPSFIQLYNINLERESISWYEYRMMLEGCFLNPCTLHEVINIRQMKIPTKGDADHIRGIQDMKHKYMLRSNDNGLGSLFRSLKGVAKRGG